MSPSPCTSPAQGRTTTCLSLPWLPAGLGLPDRLSPPSSRPPANGTDCGEEARLSLFQPFQGPESCWRGGRLFPRLPLPCSGVWDGVGRWRRSVRGHGERLLWIIVSSQEGVNSFEALTTEGGLCGTEKGHFCFTTACDFIGTLVTNDSRYGCQGADDACVALANGYLAKSLLNCRLVPPVHEIVSSPLWLGVVGVCFGTLISIESVLQSLPSISFCAYLRLLSFCLLSLQKRL